MNILLTHGYFIEDDIKEQVIMKPYPPLGILYISSYLEQNGFDNKIFDSTFFNFELLTEELKKFKPDVIGIYTNLMTKLNVLKLIRYIKQNTFLSHTKIILGGPEVSNHANNFLIYGADVIVIGEGEVTMLELVTAFNNQTSISTINGIAYLDQNNKMIKTNERDKIRSMDDLPFPNRKKINLQLYFDAWKKKHGLNTISISTMRGCPYTCKWCSRAVYGQSYRRRSASLVADEMEWIENNYTVDTAWFVDDVFTISHKWLQEFADQVTARKIKLKYECITRADRLNEHTIRLLKQSGCFRVWIGAESGSQRVIDLMDRRVKVQQVRDMIQLARHEGLEAGTFIMVGYPGESEEDIKETLHHLKQSNPDYYTITTAYPIKGTPLYESVESSFTTSFLWDQNTDRDIDFKRTYSRKYYDYAIRWIYNEVALHKLTLTQNETRFKIPLLKAKSLAARSLMWFEKSFR